MGDHPEPRLQPLFGLTAQFFDLVIGEFRQDRITAIGLECTAARNFNSIFNRFGQIGE